MKKPTPSAPECALETDGGTLTTNETIHNLNNVTAPPPDRAEGNCVRTNSVQEAVKLSPSKSRNTPQDPELHRLRRLLFPHELEMLDKLRPLLNNRRAEAEHLSSIIAEAMIIRAGKDNHMSAALEPLVGNIVRESIHSNRQEFTNALFPLMGPSIRKSIAETFRSMLESFSKSMEMSFSWKGLRWRFEALRTGKSFSEVVLLHTLVYRVEEIFLIHSSTGINILEVTGEGIDSPDASMISAMLTAIQDFVQDCLTTGKEGDLESMQHGEHIFLVEKHPLAYLACIVRGTPPADFRVNMRACLEHILVEYGDKLENFTGDTEPFAPCRPRLEKLLEAHYMDEDKPIPIWSKIMVALALTTLIGGCFFYQWTNWRQEKQIREETARRFEAVELLRQEPGVVIFHVQTHKDSPWQIFGMKDEIAKAPEDALREKGFDPSVFDFSLLSFVSYDYNIVQQRLYNAIAPVPPTAEMRFHNSVLYLFGQAPIEWILETKKRAMLVPGVKGVNTHDIFDPRMSDLNIMIHQVESAVIEFPSGKDMPAPKDMPNLNKVVDTLIKLEKMAGQMNFTVGLTIYGHADATGSQIKNYEISQARARTIAAMLYAQGSSMPIYNYGLGAEYANRKKGTRADKASRKIEIRVHLSKLSESASELPDYLD